MKTIKQLKRMMENWAEKSGLKDEPEIEDLEKSYQDFRKILKQFRSRKPRPTTEQGKEAK
jgi:hypothetical protein